MFPLKLLLINGKITNSSNYPLELWALDKLEQKSVYYAKPFRKIGINSFPTAKEIIGCEMALVFDLPTPSYDIIIIDESKLSSYYSENEIRKFYKGYKFCSKKINQYAGFNPFISVGFLRDYQIAGIFAFDVFMQNLDRGGFRNKPNLMINDDNLIMIDHELTLSFINNKPTPPNYENNYRIYPYQHHVLINHLKAIREKNHIFDEFFEYLNAFNIHKLNLIFNEMDSFNIEYGDRLDYFLYFSWCKKNLDFIKNQLLVMIQ